MVFTQSSPGQLKIRATTDVSTSAVRAGETYAFGASGVFQTDVYIPRRDCGKVTLAIRADQPCSYELIAWCIDGLGLPAMSATVGEESILVVDTGAADELVTFTVDLPWGGMSGLRIRGTNTNAQAGVVSAGATDDGSGS